MNQPAAQGSSKCPNEKEEKSMLWTTIAVTTLLAVAPVASQSNATQDSAAMCNAPNEAALKPHSPTNEEINAAEVGNPESPDYNDRQKYLSGGDWNADWRALEAGNPDSPDYKDRRNLPRDEDWKAEWEALEAGNPHKAQAGDSPATDSSCYCLKAPRTQLGGMIEVAAHCVLGRPSATWA